MHKGFNIWKLVSGLRIGPQKWLREWRILNMRRGWDSRGCWAWRREGSWEILPMFPNAWWKGMKKRQPDFSVVPANRTRSNGHALNPMKFCLNTREDFFFTVEHWSNSGTAFPGRLWSLHLWRYSKPGWTTCPVALAACCRWPCFSRGVGVDDLERSYPSSMMWFCEQAKNCVVLYFPTGLFKYKEFKLGPQVPLDGRSSHCVPKL